LPGLAQAWDAAALDAFLTFGFVPPPATLHPAIRQLAPAEIAVWEGGRLRFQRYWHLAFPERRLGASEAAALVREQAREAIRLRLAGVVAGLLLSGGLDAAALLALVAADRRPPAGAYTATFAGEGRAAARLAAQLGIEHVLVDGEPEWPAVLERLLAAHGGPGASLDDPVFALAAARAAADVRVALAGVGGDEIFGGSAPARAAGRVGYYARLPALAREMIELSTRVAPALWSPAVHATVGGARLAPLELYARQVSLVLPEERGALYTPEALEAMGEAMPWRALAGLFADAAAAGATDTRDAFHYVDVAFRLPARAAVTAAAAAAGADCRQHAAGEPRRRTRTTAPAERGDGGSPAAGSARSSASRSGPAAAGLGGRGAQGARRGAARTEPPRRAGHLPARPRRATLAGAPRGRARPRAPPLGPPRRDTLARGPRGAGRLRRARRGLSVSVCHFPAVPHGG